MLSKIRLITTVSASLEFFDFTLLIFLAPVIAHHFFPAESGIHGIMPVLMVFFAGYLARFVGGVLFGHFGDVIGRKQFYMYSITLMSLSTLAIGLLPSFAVWGALAPWSLLLLRIFQGISLGGEVPGSVIFASEYADTRKRAVATGLVVFGVTFGNVLASGMVSALYSVLGEQTVYEWGWRLAFIIGSLLGFISLWLRRSLNETPVYQKMSRQKHSNLPLSTLSAHHKLPVVQGFLLSAIPAVGISTLLFMPRFQKAYLQGTDLGGSFNTMIAFLLLATIALLTALVIDKKSRIPLIKAGSLLLIITVPLSFYVLIYFHIPLMLALLPLILSVGMIMGIYEVCLVELFPTEVRFSGISICHNLAFSLFGGVTPLLLEWASSHGWVMTIGLLPMLFGIALLAVSPGWKDHYHTSLLEI
ncbi:hypothetical protein GZ77_25985 [Endozoicomonas montiporae]|uniref:Major facilitator superfamily (MFS) profile domain-containing protein n=1 Tax=Endozoicomonas montiporae TaxID=1027273 RepID=A0A081MYR2_9GAMM|nr:MFS transporter [Endozoicomonas montiporae]KEQ11335.1 hypothetical protein GZ77_25985 [Endozoicomonas montiporae]